MEADCAVDKCLIYKEISEQLRNSSSINSKIAPLINGGNTEQLLNMHHEDVASNSTNDTIYDKLLDNLSFHNVNTYANDTENIADGPYEINFTDLIFVVVFCLLIIIVIIGNTLVILSVLTTR